MEMEMEMVRMMRGCMNRGWVDVVGLVLLLQRTECQGAPRNGKGLAGIALIAARVILQAQF